MTREVPEGERREENEPDWVNPYPNVVLRRRRSPSKEKGGASIRNTGDGMFQHNIELRSARKVREDHPPVPVRNSGTAEMSSATTPPPMVPPLIPPPVNPAKISRSQYDTTTQKPKERPPIKRSRVILNLDDLCNTENEVTRSTPLNNLSILQKELSATFNIQRNVLPGNGDKKESRQDLDTQRLIESGLTLIGIIALIYVILPYYHSFPQEDPDDCHLTSHQFSLRWKQLEIDVRENIFGQELAVDGALSAIFGHLTDSDPPKALVLSFHGWLGSGKTYLSHIIANNLFRGGIKSSHVKAFIGPRHFLPDPALVHKNQEKLFKMVETTIRACERSLFIFDEADKMPVEILNSLTPFIGHQVVDGIDYRKGIFIFISNTGGERINNVTLEALKHGRKREDLTQEDFKSVFSPDSFPEPHAGSAEENCEKPGGKAAISIIGEKIQYFLSLLWNSFSKSCNCEVPQKPLKPMARDPGGILESEISQKGLVSQFLPFLPLQRKHIRMCSNKELRRRKVINVDPMKIVSSLNYFPADEEIFARDGCKNVASHVGRHLTRAQSQGFQTQILTA